MTSRASLVFWSLAAALVLLPLGIKKPGVPMLLHGHEPSDVLLATSLAHDRNAVVEQHDLERLFRSFPFQPAMRLSLASDDGWQTAKIDRPLLYPALTVPFVAAFGVNGMSVFNATLLLLCLALLWSYLRQHADDSRALLVAAVMLLASTALVYVFELHSALLAMTLLCAAFTIIWSAVQPISAGRVLLSGVCLALAASLSTSLAWLAIPLLARLRRPRLALIWLLGAALGLALTLGQSLLWHGTALPSQFTERASFDVESPWQQPWRDGQVAAAPLALASPQQDSLMGIAQAIWLSLVEQRSGLLPYFPFLICILLTLRSRQQSRSWWLLAASLVGLVLAQPWLADPQVGAGLIANPNLVALYPLFALLLPRLPSGRMLLLGCALSAWTLSTLWFTPFGSPVPQATFHAHTRALPFTLLPLAWHNIGRAGGFERLSLDELSLDEEGSQLWVPRDGGEIHGDEVWTLGGLRVVMYLTAKHPLTETVLQVRNWADDNRVALTLGGDRHKLRFAAMKPEGEAARVTFEPGTAEPVTDARGNEIYVHRFIVDTAVGQRPAWRQRHPSNEYVGAAVAYLGSPELLQRDLFAADWQGCGAPPRVATSEEFLVLAHLTNASQHPWPAHGAARVRFGHAWRSQNAPSRLVSDSRVDLEAKVPPGDTIRRWIPVTAPPRPGRYELEIEPILENIAWFGDHDEANRCRTAIVVYSPRATKPQP